MGSVFGRRARFGAAGALALAALCACSAGGSGAGDGEQDQGSLNFDEANMRYAAGLAARTVDAFAPLSDLLDSSFAALWQTGLLVSGDPKPLSICAEGSAVLVWHDAGGDGAWSSGDSAALALTGCRPHPGDADALGGSLGLSFSDVTLGPPRRVVAVVALDLAAGAAPADALGGRLEVTATSPDGVVHSIEFRPLGDEALVATGSVSFELACYHALNGYHPAPGFRRWIAVTGSIRTLGKVMSFSPGARLRFDFDDLPAGEDEVALLSFMENPRCPALGISEGVGGSDGSTLVLRPGETPGDMRLELRRPGQPPSTVTALWRDLLHADAPRQGVVDGTNPEPE